MLAALADDVVSVATSTLHWVQVPRLYDVRRESAQQNDPTEPVSVRRVRIEVDDANIRTMNQLFNILVLVGACWSAPVDEPVRVDLPVYDQPQVSSDLAIAQPLEPENHPGGEPERQTTGNFAANKLQAVSSLLDGKAKQSSFNFGGPFSAPVTERETVSLETEDFGSKTLSFKENIQHTVAGLFQPKPIVDTISESEKYGNTGDKFYNTGRALVGGAESVSNLVNSILEVPSTIIRKISRVATEKLNNFGGRLIGL